MTAPDVHEVPTRRALRERARGVAAHPDSAGTDAVTAASTGSSSGVVTTPADSDHPPIFKPPPAPWRPHAHRPVAPAPLLTGGATPVRHRARPGRLRPFVASAAAVALAACIVGAGATLTAASVTGQPVATVVSKVADATVGRVVVTAVDAPAPVRTKAPAEVLAVPAAGSPPVALIAPTITATPFDACAVPEVAAAFASGDDGAAVAAFGGAEAFRVAAAAGTASCITLGDAGRSWVVVDKLRPLGPIDYRPGALVAPDGVRMLERTALRPDAATAMSQLVRAAASAGAGEVAVLSAFRSYDTQVASYGNHVAERGEAGADLVSARPGYSEHQTGLAADVVACDGGRCGTLDDLAASAQGRWIAEHAWEYGWIVRYEADQTAVTGYSPEPWHLRYVGADLARAYHDGGFRSLEAFFGLPAAPGYAD